MGCCFSKKASEVDDKINVQGREYGTNKKPTELHNPEKPQTTLLRVCVDFGTLYTSLAKWENSEPVVINLRNESRLCNWIECSNETLEIGSPVMDITGERGKNNIYHNIKRDFVNSDVPEISQKLFCYTVQQIQLSTKVNSMLFVLPVALKDSIPLLKGLCKAEGLSSVRFLSDVSAIIAYHVFANNIQIEYKKILVVSVGAGFTSTASASVSGLSIEINQEISSNIGLIDVIYKFMDLVHKKAAPLSSKIISKEQFGNYGRFFNECREKMIALSDPQLGKVHFDYFFLEHLPDVPRLSDDAPVPKIFVTQKEYSDLLDEVFSTVFTDLSNRITGTDCECIIVEGGGSFIPTIVTKLKKSFKLTNVLLSRDVLSNAKGGAAILSNNVTIVGDHLYVK